MSQPEPKFRFVCEQTVFGAEYDRRMRRAFDIILNFKLDDENENAADSSVSKPQNRRQPLPRPKRTEQHRITSNDN